MRSLPLITVLFLLGGCCECEGPNMEDAIYFQFDSTFSPSEVDKVKIVRLQENSLNKIDSVEVIPSLDNEFSFTLSRSQPFSHIEKFWQYDYLIVVKTGAVFHLTEISINGESTRSPFCTCYDNTKKKLTLDGAEINLTGAGSSWYESRVVLSK